MTPNPRLQRTPSAPLSRKTLGRAESQSALRDVPRLVVCLAAVALLIGPVAHGGQVPGWEITRVGGEPGQETCVATLRGGPADLAIATQGPLLWLTVSSPALRTNTPSTVMTLKTRDLGEIRRDSRVVGPTYGVTIDNELDALLTSGGSLVINLQSHDFRFMLKNASEVIDEVRRCAGQPPRAEMKARRPPTALAGGWELLEIGTGCSARLNGSQGDTLVSINEKDQVLLMAGHHDWNVWEGKRSVQVQFDAGPPRSLDGYGFANMVFVLLPSEPDVAALRKASKITWRLPTGEYSAAVHDTGQALDAATSCTRNKRKPPA